MSVKIRSDTPSQPTVAITLGSENTLVEAAEGMKEGGGEMS